MITAVDTNTNDREAPLVATYRLQLTPEFDFEQARALIPYLTQLGVSHIYLSPITESQQGSTHGYDVVDHGTVRGELGGGEGFEALRREALAAGLGLVLDFVPNHAGVGPRNLAWQDLLAYGPHSAHQRTFDVDFAPLKDELQNKLLLPFLGETYGAVLEQGQLSLCWEREQLFCAYWDHRFAINPAGYARALEHVLPALERTEHYWEAKELAELYADVGGEERERAEAARHRLAMLASAIDLPTLLKAIDTAALHELLEQQYWRLSYWKTAGYEINYRRFFDINGLVALRMEEPTVFFAAHELLARLVNLPGIDGLRIDHVDGLSDPAGYLERLRELGARRVWVEKILAWGETLPERWPVSGTTGYEFMNDVVRLLIPEASLPYILRIWARYWSPSVSWREVEHHSRHLVMATMLASELFRLAYELDRISEADYRTRDFTLEALREALSEVIAAFGRYRTYLPDDDEAREVIETAVAEARMRNPAFEQTVYTFIAQTLLEPVEDPELEARRQAWIARFQQYTAPVAAKGVEDTAFYRHLPFVALNEVGGDPDRPTIPPQVFHSHCRFRALRYPENLLSTATHDHKRGEDTRMRLCALAELHPAWQKAQRALTRATRRHRGRRGPSPADTHLFQQILLATFDDGDEATRATRLADYMVKAAREAKLQTSWLSPDEDYEADLRHYATQMVGDRWLRRALAPLARDVARLGFRHGITQLVLKLTTPGIPDIYQGCELLDLSLVDPDNRRAVDYGRRQRLLDELEPLLAAPEVDAVQRLVADADERLKLFVLTRLLRLRRRRPEIFAGAYHELPLEGRDREQLLLFGRGGDEASEAQLAVAVGLRQREDAPLQCRLGLPAGSWRDVLCGQRYEISDSDEQGLSATELPLPWVVLFREDATA